MGNSPYERDLWGWAWSKSWPAALSRPTGRAATGTAADRQWGRHGRHWRTSGRWIGGDRQVWPSKTHAGPVGKPHIMLCHEDWDSREWGTVE